MGQSWSRTYPCYGYGGWLWRIKFDLVARGLTSKEKCLFLIMSCLAAKLCPTLCNPMDCSLTDSSVHGLFQVRILEGVAIPFFKGSSVPRDQSWVSCNCGQILYCLSHQGSSSRVYFISFHFSSLKFLNKFFWCPYTSAKTFFLLSSFHQQSQVYSVKRASQHPPLRPGFSHCLTKFSVVGFLPFLLNIWKRKRKELITYWDIEVMHLNSVSKKAIYILLY